MKILKIAQSNKFYHGSFDLLPIDTILVPQSDYEKRWGTNPFYTELEQYRPSNKLASRELVFMCESIDDVGLAGGAETYIYEVLPLGKIEKHDVNWASEMDLALDANKTESEKMKIAHNYWNGIPHFNENVWEYVTTSARIIQIVYNENDL